METPTSRIIDAHTHVASVDFIPLSFLERAADNVHTLLRFQGIASSRAKLLELYLGRLQDDNAEELVSEMAAAGIDKSILLLPDFTFALRDTKLSIAEMFDRHRAILERWPEKFFVFAGVDPRWGIDGVRLFEKGVSDYGFHGLKLYPPCGYSPSDARLYPFYEICAAHQIPVLTHTGPTSPLLSFDLARPILVDQAARDFPNVNFILAHGTGCYAEECIMLCSYRPNVFLDVSGFQTMPVENLRHLFSRKIDHKIIFGTDWPLFRLQGDQRSAVESLIRDEGPINSLSPRTRAAFFRENIERLINVRKPVEVGILRRSSGLA